MSIQGKLLPHLRNELKQVADPDQAPIMRAYMKSTMPYHGVQTPILRKLCKRVFANIELPTASVWQSHVLTLWREAQFREERYAALNLAADRRAHSFHTLKAMPMFEEMIVSGAWWDYVDVIASHRVGLILRNHPTEMKKKMRAWSRCPNLWKRRTSIICQLGFGKDTDLDLLYSCIEPSMGSKEFFLQKGMAWALRQYAWKDPKEITRYVGKNEARLSPLTKREALKNIVRTRSTRPCLRSTRP
jgi:3-methyladenine DNA glycosylase AlkD